MGKPKQGHHKRNARVSSSATRLYGSLRDMVSCGIGPLAAATADTLVLTLFDGRCFFIGVENGLDMSGGI